MYFLLHLSDSFIYSTSALSYVTLKQSVDRKGIDKYFANHFMVPASQFAA